MIPAALLACAPNVAPATLEAIIKVESGGHPQALHVNGLSAQPSPPHDVEEARQVAAGFIARGYSVDLGLMQVNNRHLAGLGITIEQALDPCTNIRVGAAILTDRYAEALRNGLEGQGALRAALSAYNTGDFYRGLSNGYVAHYYGPSAGRCLAKCPRGAAGALPTRNTAAAAAPNPYTADSGVFAREATNVRIE